MGDDIIRVLEERVSALEREIYGSIKISGADNISSESSVVESLINANVFLSSALSGRENANALITRLGELISYMDPQFEESGLQIDAKMEFISAMESDIKDNLRLLTEMQSLLPVLETDRIRDVPELSTKLNSLTLDYIKMQEDSKTLTSDIHELFNKYNAVVTSISESLIALDASITAAEMAAEPKKQLD